VCTWLQAALRCWALGWSRKLWCRSRYRGRYGRLCRCRLWLQAAPAHTHHPQRWSLWQGSKDIPWDTKPTSGVVGLTVLQPEFLKQFPTARFHFNSGDCAQRGTFKGVWLNKEHTEWALEKEQQ
jgi:hypothetical protein